jgi:hypothetical protein
MVVVNSNVLEHFKRINSLLMEACFDVDLEILFVDDWQAMDF